MRYNKKEKVLPLDRIGTQNIHLEGTVFIQLTTKDRLTKQFTNLPVIYPNKLVYIKSLLNHGYVQGLILKWLASFLLKSGYRQFPPFKIIVSYQVIIHVYSSIWKKKVLTCDVFAVSDAKSSG